MKVLHTSDWHLGRKFLTKDMHEHQEAFVDWIAITAQDLGIELVVIAGDIFDRSVPPQESVALFEKALMGLSAICPVFVIPGNHDSAVRLGYGGSFFAASGVHIQSRTDSMDHPLVVTSPDGTELAVYGIPYLHPDIHAAEFAVQRTHTAVLTHAMGVIRADLAHRRDIRSMVVAHAFVTGGSGSESERDLEIGGIGDAPSSVFAGVDYTAMGHLHGAQVISSESGVIRYSGSPLPYSFSEEKHVKSVTLIDIPPRGEITTTVIPVPQPAPLVTLRGSIDFLETDSSLEVHIDSWVRCQITDQRRPENAMKRLSQRFNHVLHLVFDPETNSSGDMKSDGGVNARLDPQKTPPLELAAAFIAHVTNDQVTETERDLMQSAIETVNSQVMES